MLYMIYVLDIYIYARARARRARIYKYTIPQIHLYPNQYVRKSP